MQEQWLRNAEPWEGGAQGTEAIALLPFSDSASSSSGRTHTSRDPSAHGLTLLTCPQDAYDINQLCHPTELTPLNLPLGTPSLRRDAPFGYVRRQPHRALPTSPADMANFISDVGALRVWTHVHVHARTHKHAQIHKCTCVACQTFPESHGVSCPARS
jgi:hypothetical protein